MTQRYAYFKMEVKCGVTYHGKKENDRIDYPNIATFIFSSQKKLGVRDRNKERELSKR